jgi:hypothetical protein
MAFGLHQPRGHVRNDPPPVGDIRAAAEAVFHTVLGDATVDGQGTEIEHRSVEESPAAVLVGESQSADVLVVGSRGHGGITQLLLGSASNRCAQDAECPVRSTHRPFVPSGHVDDSAGTEHRFATATSRRYFAAARPAIRATTFTSTPAAAEYADASGRELFAALGGGQPKVLVMLVIDGRQFTRGGSRP